MEGRRPLAFDGHRVRAVGVAYRLTMHVDQDVLRVETEGTRSLEAVTAIANDILRECRQKSISDVLVDVKALRGRLSTVDSFELSDTFFETIREQNVLRRCAIVDRVESEGRSKVFLEVASMNRNYPLRIFRDKEKALDWLRNRGEEGGPMSEKPG